MYNERIKEWKINGDGRIHGLGPRESCDFTAPSHVSLGLRAIFKMSPLFKCKIPRGIAKPRVVVR